MDDLTMHDLLETMVKGIVEQPDQVDIIEEDQGNGRIILTIGCAETDRGLVIGGQGRNINAMRTIMKIKAIKERKYVEISLLDDGNIKPREVYE